MKQFLKLFGVMVLAVAMTGLVACGSDSDNPSNDTNVGTDENTGTDTNTGNDENNVDTNRPDEGTPEDTNVGSDTKDTNVGTDTNVETDTNVPCDPTANCGTKVCGPSGCVDGDGNAIMCGTCGAEEVCNEIDGTCVATCTFPDDLPQTWGKSGVVNALRVPANATEKTPCFDYTGDGNGDCGLTGLASQVNPPLQDMMTDGTMAIIFEFADVADFTTTASFTLKGLLGEPVTAGTLAGDMYVDQASYMEDSCLPMISFKDASITAGALAAGPGNFRISVPLSAELLLTVNLIDAQIKGDLTASDNGVAAANGVLSGVVTKAELTAIIDSIDVECKKVPKPESVEDICPYLGVARGAMAMLFDMHQVGDGTYVAKDAENPGDAASLCLTFTLAESKVTGYVPAN